jgi:O-antigen/teichoic acid export membrane protein
MLPALVQGKDMNDANYDAAWTLDLSRSFLLTIVTIASAPLIASMFAEPRAVPIIMALALRPLIESMTSIKAVTLNRNLMFRPLALLRIIEAIVNTALSILLAGILGVWALVAGAIGGAISIVVTSYFVAPYRPRLLFSREAIRPLINFGRWIFATHLIALTGSYMLRVVISRQFGSAGLGIYFLATQLAFLPSDVASEAVGAVAFPLFARLQNDVQQATRVFRALFSGLAAVLYPVCALIIIFAPSLTHEILGPNWGGTEELIRILALVVMISIFGEVAISVFKGFGQPYRITLVEVIQSSVTVALVWILTKRFGLAGAALAWLPTISFSQVLSALFLQKILDHPFRGLYKPLMAVLTATGVCVAIAMTFRNLIPGLAGLISAIALGAVSAVILLWAADRLYSLGFARNLALAFPQVAAFVGSFHGK